MKTLKNIIKTVVVMGVLAICFMLYAKTNEYQLSGKIIMVANDHWCMVETSDGNVWEFDGYGYYEGQKVTVKLDSRDTTDKTDDIVLDVY